MGLRGYHLRLGQKQLRAELLHRLLPCRDRGSDLVHLVYGDKLLGQQRLDAMKVIGLIEQFSVGAVECSLHRGDICFGFADGGYRAIDVRRSAVSIGLGCANGTYLRGNRPSLVDNLTLQRVQVGPRFFERVFVWPRIDLKQQVPLFAVLIVLDRELDDRAVYLWSDADKIGKYLRIIRAWVLVGAA